jgi:hypothetical protein
MPQFTDKYGKPTLVPSPRTKGKWYCVVRIPNPPSQWVSQLEASLKAWRDLREVPMPGRVAALPRDPRGYPIPASAYAENGAANFTVIDQLVSSRLFHYNKCGICGTLLGRFRALVGGAKSMQFGLFTDIPMHVECAEYALAVCPFLAAPSFAYRRSQPKLDIEVQVYETVSTERPKIFGLGVTTARPFLTRNGNEWVIKVPSWERVE